MISVVNPLIFRSKYYPVYTNKINVYYSHGSNMSPLLLKSRIFGSKKKSIIVTVVERYKRNIFFNIKSWNKVDLGNFFSFYPLRDFTFFKGKFVLSQVCTVMRNIDYIIHYILEHLINSSVKISIRRLLMHLALLLLREYNLSGFKCVISGRIKGAKRARKEMFNLGDSSVVSPVVNIRYRSSYVVTKHGKLGIKL